VKVVYGRCLLEQSSEFPILTNLHPFLIGNRAVLPGPDGKERIVTPYGST